MENHQVSRMKVDISLAAILKILAVILGLLFIVKIKDILLLLFVVLILVTALSPIVDRLVKHFGIPRWLAVGLIFGGVGAIMLIMIWLILPKMVSQIIDLLNQPQIQSLIGGSESHSFINDLQTLADKIPGITQGGSGVVSFFSTILGGIVSVFTVAVLSLYLLLEEDGIKKFIHSILPTKHKQQIVNTFHKISLKMGAWFRGQLLLGLIIGLISMVILLAFGVPFWLTLAIFAGLTELIPYVGPFIGLAAALFVALTRDSFWGFNTATVGIGVTIGYLLVQQLESHFLVPKVMEKSVGLSPVVVIIAILIGAKLFGLLGVVLSVPAAAVISVIIDEWPAIQAAYFDSRGELVRPKKD